MKISTTEIQASLKKVLDSGSLNCSAVRSGTSTRWKSKDDEESRGTDPVDVELSMSDRLMKNEYDK